MGPKIVEMSRRWLWTVPSWIYIYRKVANSSTFSDFQKAFVGEIDAYVLWPLAKKFQNWIVEWSTARDFTVCKQIWLGVHYWRVYDSE